MKSVDALKRLSKVQSLPLLNFLSPSATAIPSSEALEGHLQSQRLGYRAVKEVAKMMTDGWTEKQAADMVGTFLKDSGVKSFFHHPFAWFGDRSRFAGMRRYSDFMPGKRVLLPGEVFILDVAPIFKGYVSDIGYTSSVGESAELDKTNLFLRKLRKEIPDLINGGMTGRELWKKVEDEIVEAGYTNAYKIYPFSVLGHRVHKSSEATAWLKYMNFGWQSYWSLTSRGVFGQLLGPHFEGEMTGIWAIEPHLGAKDYGAKFEEILVVDKQGARWLETDAEKGWDHDSSR